jgi:hypothetical protein
LNVKSVKNGFSSLCFSQIQLGPLQRGVDKSGGAVKALDADSRLKAQEKWEAAIKAGGLCTS